jgi:hypothetical protein
MNFKSNAVLALAALLSMPGADAATRYVNRFRKSGRGPTPATFVVRPQAHPLS